MIITIHRGSHQIGGCATEIRTENSRILIDAGSELDGNAPLKIEGVTEGTSKCNAVLFSHYHGDHIGLLDTVNNDIPLYIGNISLEIIKMQNKRQKLFDESNIQRIKPYYTAKPMVFGDIKVTPFMVDHSAFDSHLFIIEAGGKRILHTGDFRNHGFRGKGLIPTLTKYFDYCPNLEKVNVSAEHPFFKSVDGVLFSKSNVLLYYPTGKKDTNYIVPEGTNEIAGRAFCHSQHLENITIANSVTSLGDSCFCDASKLNTIHFGTNITSIGEEAFQGTGFITFSFPIGVETSCPNLKYIFYLGTESQFQKFRDMKQQCSSNCISTPQIIHL